PSRRGVQVGGNQKRRAARRGMRNLFRSLVMIGLILGLTGCGAAIYGAVIGAYLSQQGKTTQINASFPDSVPTADVVPAFAALILSPKPVTITRKVTTATVQQASPSPSPTASPTTNPSPSPSPSVVPPSDNQTITDFQIQAIDFPAGFGEARSNRDTGT